MFWLWFLGIVIAIFLLQWYLFRIPDGQPYVGNSNSPIDESLIGTAVSSSHFTRYASAFRTGPLPVILESVVLRVRCVAGASVTLRVLLHENGDDGPTGPNLIDAWPVQTCSCGDFENVTLTRAGRQKFVLQPNRTYWIAFYGNNTAGETSAEWARTTENAPDERSIPGASIPSTANFYVSSSRGIKWAACAEGAPGVFGVFVSTETRSGNASESV